MTRRTLLGALVAPLLPAIPVAEECFSCREPGGAEGTGYCAACLEEWRARYRLEFVRLNPQAGDVITGPNGTRVEVTDVLTQTLSDGTQIEMVYYNKVHPVLGAFALIARMEQWQNMSDWDSARIA